MTNRRSLSSDFCLSFFIWPKNPCRLAKDFQFSSTDPCPSVVSFILLVAAMPEKASIPRAVLLRKQFWRRHYEQWKIYRCVADPGMESDGARTAPSVSREMEHRGPAAPKPVCLLARREPRRGKTRRAVPPPRWRRRGGRGGR